MCFNQWPTSNKRKDKFMIKIFLPFLFLLPITCLAEASDVNSAPPTENTPQEEKPPVEKPPVEKLEDITQLLVTTITSSPKEICALSNVFIRRVKSDPILIKNHLKTGQIARNLFSVRKQLIENIAKVDSTCKIQAREIYTNLKNLEYPLVFNSSIIIQGTYEDIDEEYGSVDRSNFSEFSKQKSLKNYSPENGDIFLARELRLGMNLPTYLSNEFSLYDIPWIVKKSKSNDIQLLTIDPIKGPISISLNNYLNKYIPLLFEFIVLRPKINSLKENLSSTFDQLVKESNGLGNSQYDYAFSSKNKKKYYADKIIYDVVFPYSKDHLSSHWEESPFTLLDSKNDRMAKESLSFYFPLKELIFSNLFYLEMEWSQGKAFRIEELKKMVAQTIRQKQLTYEKKNEFFYFVLKSFWMLRHFPPIKSIIKDQGVSEVFIQLDSFHDALYLSTLNKVLTLCSPKIINETINEERKGEKKTPQQHFGNRLEKCIEEEILTH